MRSQPVCSIVSVRAFPHVGRSVGQGPLPYTKFFQIIASSGAEYDWKVNRRPAIFCATVVNKRSRLLTRNKKQKLGISKTSQTAAEITCKCSTPAFTKDICAIIAWNYRWSNFLGICIIDSLHHFGVFLLNAST